MPCEKHCIYGSSSYFTASPRCWQLPFWQTEKLSPRRNCLPAFSPSGHGNIGLWPCTCHCCCFPPFWQKDPLRSQSAIISGCYSYCWYLTLLWAALATDRFFWALFPSRFTFLCFLLVDISDFMAALPDMSDTEFTFICSVTSRWQQREPSPNCTLRRPEPSHTLREWPITALRCSCLCWFLPGLSPAPKRKPAWGNGP